jgi:hypothetical protein
MRVRLGPVAGDYTRVEWSLDASCMVTLSALIRKGDGVARAATRIEAIAAGIPTGLTSASYSGRNVEAS